MIFDQYRYEVAPWLRSVQRILLGLILLGIILLATQTFWVPSLVSYLLQQESIREKVSGVEEVTKTPLPDGVKSEPVVLASSTTTSSPVSDVLPGVPPEATEEVILPPKTVPSQRCVVGGCSGQLCTDDPSMISTCEYRPEYACYASATCARQETGECGWTETSELRSCLANPPGLR
jgi:hypothetical protein